MFTPTELLYLKLKLEDWNDEYIRSQLPHSDGLGKMPIDQYIDHFTNQVYRKVRVRLEKIVREMETKNDSQS